MSDNLVCPDDVKVTGISKITRKDVEAAESFGCKIKLLGVAEMRGGKLLLEVSPYCIADNVPLYGIEDVFNGIMVDTDAAGTVMFYGRGAGKLPTASAVVSDIIDIAARKGAKSQFAPWKDGKDMIADDDREYAYLMRVGGDVADFEKKFNICAHITEENVVAFVTDKFNTEEYDSFCKILEERGYSVISSYKVFA